MLESDYPYTATDGTCQFDAAKGVTNCASFYEVATGDEGDLLNACWTKGAVSVCIDASVWTFQAYSGGVYDEPGCSLLYIDHAVACVGWGVDGALPYWIVKNSWGTEWGEQGYIRMSRNKNNQCLIASHAVVPVAK
jgi:cathepsin L